MNQTGTIEQALDVSKVYDALSVLTNLVEIQNARIASMERIILTKPEKRLFYTVPEAANALRCCEEEIRRYIRRKLLRVSAASRKNLRIHAPDVENFFENTKVARK